MSAGGETNGERKDCLDVSIVIPCLNEETTVEAAIAWAREAIQLTGMSGEVVVADNGSTDQSVALAEKAGARVIRARRKGYGYALLAGFRAARGRYLVMGDADATYDFREAVGFIRELERGADLVMGSRLRGQIAKGSMPFLHRWLGTPVLSLLINVFFGLRITDCNCGMRALTRQAFHRLALVSGGMEFASEMIVKAGLYRLKVAEIPCSLHADRRNKPSHLRTWRDGWRHLRFILLFAPHVVFQIPGWIALLAGGAVTAAVLPAPIYIGGRILDYHYLFYGIPLLIMGYQALWFDQIESYYVRFAGYLPDDLRRSRTGRAFNLELWLIVGLLLSLIGGAIFVAIILQWVRANFGDLRAIRASAAAMLFLILGVQTMMNALIISMMDIKVDRS